MTEDEAQTKWCPFVRLTDGGQMYFDNRGRQFGGASGKDGEDASTCIGSACMAWRTTIVPIDSGNVVFNVQNKIVGYCGLAGEP